MTSPGADFWKCRESRFWSAGGSCRRWRTRRRNARLHVPCLQAALVLRRAPSAPLGNAVRGAARAQLPHPRPRRGEGAGPDELRPRLRGVEEGRRGDLRSIRSPEPERRRAVPRGRAQPHRRGAGALSLRAARPPVQRRARPDLQGRSVGDGQQPRGVRPVKNGVGRQHAGFTPWFWSYRLAAKIEAVVVVCVIAGVVAILALLFRMPGPLVVHLQDEKKDPIMGARVRCTSPDGQTSHAGSTDVFGEAKWPGLAHGPWTCEVTPPDRFHAPVQTGAPRLLLRAVQRGADRRRRREPDRGAEAHVRAMGGGAARPGAGDGLRSEAVIAGRLTSPDRCPSPGAGAGWLPLAGAGTHCGP